MSDKITVALELVGGGSIKVAAKNAEDLNEGLNKVVSTIQKADKAFASLENRKPKVAAAAMERSGPNAAEITNYNAQRGAAGAAGGTARDFAAQAQGLGGLVRLYATFAANIFAVTTAYNALQNAFKTEKMIQAAEKFSGTVGTSMRSVAKSLQEATQYSLSFQDAVKFTNVGTAAGLAAKDIKNLTVIAKGAATALGRDVGESIQRIIQGTAKQEQEILDELGIFIKSKKAFEDYAKARNMKADDLTATQRTLAYAEAVAKAGDKWKEFANIDDPFGRLNAQLQNTLTEVLNSINKIAVPLAKLFADSSSAILALGSLITSALLKRALPELKDAFLGAITFDRSRARAAADLLRINIGAELTQVKTEAAALTKQLDDATKSLTNLGSAKAKTNFATSLIPQDMAQTGSGKNINYGISAAQLSKELFKEEDLSRFKSVADINKAVESSLAAQVKHATDKNRVIEGLIAKGIIEQGSNEKNLVLSEKTIANNANILAAVQKRAAEEALIVTAHEKQEALLSRQAVLEKELAAAGGQKASRITAADILSASRAAASAAPQITGAAEAAKNSAEQVAKATLATTGNVVTGVRAMKDSFNSVGEALEKGRVAASAEGLGIVSNAKLASSTLAAMGATLASLPGQFSTASGAAAKFGVAGAAAGTLAATGFSLLRQALNGVMAALGPVMLAWTVWELAGDKIREFFNANIAYEKAAKEAKQASEDYLKVIVDLEKAFTRSNIVLRDSNSSLTEISKAYEVQANAIRSLTDSYDAYTAKLREAEALKNAPEIGKKVGVKFNEEELKLLVESQTRLKGLTELISSGKNLGVGTGALEAQKASLEGYISQLENLDKQLANGSTKSNIAAEIFKNMKNVFLDSSDAVSTFRKEFEIASSRMSATASTIEAGFNKIGSALDNDVINKLKATKAGFKDVDAYKEFTSFEKLKKDIKEAGGAISTSNIFSEKGVALDNLKKVVDANNALGQKYRELIPLEGALLKLQTARASLQNATSFGAAQAAAEQIESAQNELNNLIQSGAFGNGYKSLLESLKASTEQYSNEAKGRFKSIELAIKAAENALKALNAALEVSSKLTNFRSAFTGQANLEVQQAEKRRQIIQQEYEIELKKAQLARDKVLESRNVPESDKANARKEFDLSVASLKQTREQKLLLDDLNIIEQNRNETLRLIEERYKLSNEAAERSLTTSRGHLEVEKAYADARATSLGLTSEQSRYETVLLDQQSKRLESAAKEQALLADAQKRRDEINAKANAETTATKATSTGYLDKNDRLIIAGKLAEVEKARTEELAKVNSESQKKLDALAEEKTRMEELLGLEEKRAKLLADQSSAAQRMAKFTTALAGAFKNTGMEKQATAVANVLKVTQTYQQKLAKSDSDNVIRKQKNMDKLFDLEIKAAEGSKQAELEVQKLRRSIDEEDTKSIQNRKDMELESISESLSAFKGMFSEKTAAYKVLDAVEKAMHVARMAAMATELAANLASVGPTLAAEGAKNTARGIGAILEALKAPFPIGFVAGAAMAAIVASLIGGGGKKVTAPGGMTAKDRQETQGTGMSWVNGQKVENGNGVFGDPTSRSESIKNSLEIIADNTIEGLGYDRKMLKALEAISAAIGNTAESLYTIQGIRSGSAFGTPESSVKNSGIKGLFGSSTTRDLIDSGIKVSGIFADLAKGMGMFQQYETIQNTKKKSGFLGIGGSTSISYNTQTKALDASAKDSIAAIFANATSLFETIGDRVGLTSDAIKNKLATLNIDFEASLKGLSGKELEDALNAVISQALDKASGMLFGDQFKKFQQFGEGLLETVVRVTDTNDKMKVAFSSIGISVSNLSFDASEALAKLVGGLEKFTEQVEFYRDNFLTESEKLAAVQSNVSKVMGDLLYSTVDTREEFKALIESIDVTTESGRQLYAELMAIAPAFAEVTAKHQQLVDDYKDLETELLGTFRNNAAAKALLTLREEEGLSAAAKAQLQRNKALQKEIDALNQYYDLLDGLDEFVLTSAQIREKERNSIAESNRALFDLLNAYKDRQAAEENMRNAMSTISSTLTELANASKAASDTINSSISSLVSGYLSAQSALASAQSELANARSGLISGFFGAKDGLESAKKGTKNALTGITKGYISAKNAVENAQKALDQNTKNAAKQISDNLRRIGNSIKDFLTGLVTSDLSALDSTSKIKALQAQFDTLYTKALGGDSEAASELQNVGSALLSASMESASSREEYSRKFGEITNKLSVVSSALLDKAGPEQTVDDAQTNALQTLANAQAEFAKWQEAVNVSGAETALAEADLLEEWKNAKEAEQKANETFAKWSEAVSTALGFVPTEREDPTSKAILDATKAYQEALKKVSASEQDLAAYQTALLQVGITDLSKLSEYTDSTSKNIEKYLSEWRQATADQAAYAAKYAEAQELTKGITLTQVDQITELKKAIIEYNQASDLYKKSDDLIKNTSLENIKKAVEDAQAGIIAAIAANAKAAVTVTKDIVPMVKLTDPSAPNVTTRAGGNYGGEVGSYIPPWIREEEISGRFASGGYHPGGLRLVGENGPELEATGPARIFNAEQTQSILENGLGQREDPQLLRDLTQEIRNLRVEMAQLKAAASQTEQNTRKTKDMLENVTRGGDTIRTESV